MFTKLSVQVLELALTFLQVGINDGLDCVGCAAIFIYFEKQEGCPCIAWHR